MTVAVLLSGGVDSSVALRLLLEEGHEELRAFYLKIWLEDELAFLGECPWEDDLRHARAVCDAVGVPLEIVPLQREYWDRVVSYTIAELRAGRTPSPDLVCNRRVKFGAFFDVLDTRSGETFEAIATGHYARIDVQGGRARLLRGVDPVKDQTYFLSSLDARQLARARFPLGGMRKSEVRALANRLELPNRARRDSQGICFLGKIRFDEFVAHHLGERRGPILERGTDRILGEHRGYWFHTIGQRRGLGLGGGPWYVADKDVDRNIVWVAHAERVEDTLRTDLLTGPAHWIHGEPRFGRLVAKLRHTETLIACEVTDAGAGCLRVELEEPDRGVASGQFVVLYDGEECLGSAAIDLR